MTSYDITRLQWVKVQDALFVTEPDGDPPYPADTFDRILLDAPCSALGQRPALRNNMTLAEVKSFPVLQRKLFETVSSLCIYLNHSGLVMPYGDKDLGHHWLR